MTLQSHPRAAGGDALDERIASLGPWFHNLHLPDGRQTAPDHPLGDFPRFKWDQLGPRLPSDMSGMRALDIGCNAGFYSFELARRGADVLAVDLDEHYLEQARWAAEQLDPAGRIEWRRMGVYELGRLEERFDLVLFLGVLYHLRHPLLALDLVAERVGGTLVFQTLTMPGGEPVEPPEDLPIGARAVLTEEGWPRAAFVERSLADDPTNWWVADDACVQAMLRSSGMEVLDRPGHELYVCGRAGEDPWREARLAELASATGSG
jgi:tRNA (mo5U34)-methyltransferase